MAQPRSEIEEIEAEEKQKRTRIPWDVRSDPLFAGEVRGTLLENTGQKKPNNGGRHDFGAVVATRRRRVDFLSQLRPPQNHSSSFAGNPMGPYRHCTDHFCQPTSHFISQLTRVRPSQDPGVQRQPPMSRRTHPEKKWAAGTNESNAHGQSVVAISLVTGGSYRRHAWGVVCESQGASSRKATL